MLSNSGASVVAHYLQSRGLCSRERRRSLIIRAFLSWHASNLANRAAGGAVNNPKVSRLRGSIEGHIRRSVVLLCGHALRRSCAPVIGVPVRTSQTTCGTAAPWESRCAQDIARDELARLELSPWLSSVLLIFRLKRSTRPRNGSCTVPAGLVERYWDAQPISRSSAAR
jgi:hypothetical protein